jgi:ProP effector
LIGLPFTASNTDNHADNQALHFIAICLTSMTLTATPEALVETPAPETVATPPEKPSRNELVQPVLEKLFGLYPHLFGARFLPLKLGIFQELLARHPDDFKRDSLKAALGVHTRSAPYLQSVAAGHKRHDLDNVAVQELAPEHVALAIVELFRRRQNRSKADLSAELQTRLLAAFEKSGLTRTVYLEMMQHHAPDAALQLEAAWATQNQKQAQHEALFKAYQASGKSVEEFADMYGLTAVDVHYKIDSWLRLSRKA